MMAATSCVQGMLWTSSFEAFLDYTDLVGGGGRAFVLQLRFAKILMGFGLDRASV